MDLINTFPKRVPKKFFWDKIINKVYNWSHSHGYINGFYEMSLMNQHIFIDTQVIDRILSGFGVMSFVYKGKYLICMGWMHLFFSFFCIYLLYQSCY